jgi:hypothetical protein
MNAVEQVKQQVKEYSIVPFSARDISCGVIGGTPTMQIRDRYGASESGVYRVMDTVGIRKNLTRDIFNSPQTNWMSLQEALDSIDKSKVFNCLVDGQNNIVDVVSANVKDVTQLDYDNRIDQLMNAIDSSENYDFQNILFNPSTGDVELCATNRSHIDCGVGDDWKFGSAVSIGHNNNTFKQYFLRLICTNGMTTRENIAYRQTSATKDVGRQFNRFAEGLDLNSTIRPRVDRLRRSRASLFELKSVADCLNVEDRNTFLPEFQQTQQEFTDRGFSIDAYNRKQQKFVYTNHNLYDIFNAATNIASHRRDIVGDKACAGLNKVASEIFSKGPVLDFSVVDIYKNN